MLRGRRETGGRETLKRWGTCCGFHLRYRKIRVNECGVVVYAVYVV